MRRALLLAVVAGLAGCAELRASFVEDRSSWSPAMRRDLEECEAWALGMPSSTWGGGTPRSYGSWLHTCLRGRGWNL